MKERDGKSRFKLKGGKTRVEIHNADSDFETLCVVLYELNTVPQRVKKKEGRKVGRKEKKKKSRGRLEMES